MKKRFVFAKIFILFSFCVYSQNENLTYTILNETIKDGDEICLKIENNSSKKIILPIEDDNYFLKYVCLSVNDELKNSRLHVFSSNDSQPLRNFKPMSSTSDEQDLVNFKFYVINPNESFLIKIPFVVRDKISCNSMSASYLFKENEKYFLELIYEPRYFIEYDNYTKKNNCTYKIFYNKIIVSNKVPVVFK